MKLSVSLPDEDVEFLDEYASSHGVPTQSAAVQHAVALLRTQALSDSYEQAWADWETSEDAVVWDAAISDGLDRS